MRLEVMTALKTKRLIVPLFTEHFFAKREGAPLIPDEMKPIFRIGIKYTCVLRRARPHTRARAAHPSPTRPPRATGTSSPRSACARSTTIYKGGRRGRSIRFKR